MKIWILTLLHFLRHLLRADAAVRENHRPSELSCTEKIVCFCRIGALRYFGEVQVRGYPFIFCSGNSAKFFSAEASDWLFLLVYLTLTSRRFWICNSQILFPSIFGFIKAFPFIFLIYSLFIPFLNLKKILYFLLTFLRSFLQNFIYPLDHHKIFAGFLHNLRRYPL